MSQKCLTSASSPTVPVVASARDIHAAQPGAAVRRKEAPEKRCERAHHCCVVRRGEDCHGRAAAQKGHQAFGSLSDCLGCACEALWGTNGKSNAGGAHNAASCARLTAEHSPIHRDHLPCGPRFTPTRFIRRYECWCALLAAWLASDKR